MSKLQSNIIVMTLYKSEIILVDKDVFIRIDGNITFLRMHKKGLQSFQLVKNQVKFGESLFFFQVKEMPWTEDIYKMI